jgi:hypothetical protein
VTTYASYGLEKPDPMLALAAAERLARNAGREAARRLHDDGSIDVAVMEDRHFHLHLVDSRGLTTLVESSPPPEGRRYWLMLMWLGLVVLPIALAVAALRYPNGTEEDVPPEFTVIAIALVAAVVGALASRRYDLRWHLSKRFDDPQEWRRFREPSGWSPRSMAQLAAAERLAYYKDGKAMVRELPDGAAEVVTQTSGRLFRHRIAETGALTELPGSERSRLYLLGTGIAVAGMLGSFGAFMLLGSAFGAVGAVGGALAMMALVPLGATVLQHDSLERSVPRSEGGTWYFLRTNAEPVDD